MTQNQVAESANSAGIRAYQGYVECALWAGLDWSDETAANPEPLDANYSAEDISDEARAEIVADIAGFYSDCDIADLARLEPEHVGHDFYLTRNRHGAGFWDLGLGDAGDRLTAAAHTYGTSELYVGDDGKLYVHG